MSEAPSAFNPLSSGTTTESPTQPGKSAEPTLSKSPDKKLNLSNTLSASKPAILCIGGINLDHHMQLLSSVQMGSSNPVTSRESPGGVACNVASNMAALGCKVRLFGSIAAGRKGQWLQTLLEKRGINCSLIRRVPSSHNDSYTSIQNPDGEMILALAEMKLADSMPLKYIQEIWERLPALSAVFLDTNFPPPVLEWIIRRCASEHTVLHLDPVSAIKARKLPQSLEGIHTFQPNLSELESMSGKSLPNLAKQEKACQQLLAKGIQKVILSLGPAGLLAVSQHERLHLETEKIEAINVNGAGDALCSGVLLGEVLGWDFRKSCEAGMMMSRETILSDSSIWPGSVV